MSAGKDLNEINKISQQNESRKVIESQSSNISSDNNVVLFQFERPSCDNLKLQDDDSRRIQKNTSKIKSPVDKKHNSANDLDIQDYDDN